MRGESDRVAARVRALLDSHRESEQSSVALPSEQGPAPPAGPVPLRDRLLARVPMRVAGSRSLLLAGVPLVIGVIAIGAWVRVGKGGASVSDPPALATASATAPVLDATAAASTTAAGNGPTSTSSAVVVDVAGKVRRPGVYRLPAGSRVTDALRVAGGALPGVNVNTLNLAAPLVDGQQIAVGVRGAAGAPAAGGGDPAAAATGPINLNTATLDQLETLPGVGPVLGQRILDWRTQHGGFASVEQLDDVSGVGPARLSELKPLVTV